MSSIELIAPAGAMETLHAALNFGADGVYLGPRAFGLRSGSEDFSVDGIKRAAEEVSRRGKKLYLTLNALQYNRDLDPVFDFIHEVRDCGLGGIVISDPGLADAVKASGIPLHISTQASILNRESARFWKNQGASRIILARELSLEDIRNICDSVKMEFEIFIHGAMCVSYSGRCLLSDYLTGRSGNKGECAQPCRWGFSLKPTDDAPAFEIEEQDERSFILNSKDLCALPLLAEVLQSGVSALKIEGRNKSAHYVSVVTRVYREAIDAYQAHPEQFSVREEWLNDLASVSHRNYTTGFLGELLYARPIQITHSTGYDRGSLIIGIIKEVLSKTRAVVDIKNDFNLDMLVTLFSPEKGTYLKNSRVLSMESIQGKPETLVHTNRVVIMEFEDRVTVGSLVRSEK